MRRGIRSLLASALVWAMMSMTVWGVLDEEALLMAAEGVRQEEKQAGEEGQAEDEERIEFVFPWLEQLRRLLNL